MSEARVPLWGQPEHGFDRSRLSFHGSARGENASLCCVAAPRRSTQARMPPLTTRCAQAHGACDAHSLLACLPPEGVALQHARLHRWHHAPCCQLKCIVRAFLPQLHCNGRTLVRLCMYGSLMRCMLSFHAVATWLVPRARCTV